MTLAKVILPPCVAAVEVTVIGDVEGTICVNVMTVVEDAAVTPKTLLDALITFVIAEVMTATVVPLAIAVVVATVNPFMITGKVEVAVFVAAAVGPRVILPAPKATAELEAVPAVPSKVEPL